MRSIIQHLRFPFSYLLLPVFLLALLTHPTQEWHVEILLLFFILHFLVYPSSNAYNSTQDNDVGSVGLIKNPLPISKTLEWVSGIFDFTAVGFASIISLKTALLVLIYIAVSRLYSYRKIRLKKYPIIGFLVVFIFQGAWIYYTVYIALGQPEVSATPLGNNSLFYFSCIASSFLIGSIYPLSQIYQHESDKADGVITISYRLGIKGTFIFSGIFFLVGSGLLLFPFYQSGAISFLWTYLIFQLPSLIYFNYWFLKVLKNEKEANFEHTMRMSLISATCMNTFLLFVLFYK